MIIYNQIDREKRTVHSGVSLISQWGNHPGTDFIAEGKPNLTPQTRTEKINELKNILGEFYETYGPKAPIGPTPKKA